MLIACGALPAADVLHLDALDGSNGFRINGTAELERVGSSVSSGGDFNADGIDDLLIGAMGHASNGAGYIVFGRSGVGAQFPAVIAFGNSAYGTRLYGNAAGDFAGIAAAAVGDVNGDGLDDLLIGASEGDYAGLGSGSSYLVFGRDAVIPASIWLHDVNGSNGVRINGVGPFDRSGTALASAGDVNNDGIADLLIGAASADPNGSGSGSSYVVFGRGKGGFPAVLGLSGLNGSNGFRIDGVAAGDGSGASVSSVDFNGDGIDDLLIGATDADPNGTDSGTSYVVFGREDGIFPAVLALSTLNGSNGFRIDGVSAGDLSGRVSSAGDINGDGIRDLVIGAAGTVLGGNPSGSCYVLFGQNGGGFPAQFALSALDGSNGFRINGESLSGRRIGGASFAGDLNGDGIDDLLIGGFQHGVPTEGSSYVLFGRSGAFPAVFSLSDLDGSNGLAIDRPALAVAFAGDINGDGIDDIVIGDQRVGLNGNLSSGSSYAIFGNAAPLVQGAAQLPAGLEDAPDIASGSLSELAFDAYLDHEPLAGAAIDGNSPATGDGAWQVDPTGAGDWTPVPSEGLSSQSALLIPPEARLRFVPAPDFFGAAPPLSLRVWDGADAALYVFGEDQDIRASIGSLGGFSNDANRLLVNADFLPVNDAPSFSADDPPASDEDQGEVTVPGWITAFDPGPNETSQAVLEYQVAVSANPELFAVAPTVNVAGELSYTAMSDANGTATIVVVLRDDGGVEFGGVDVSLEQDFSISVNAVNDPPVLDLNGPAPGIDFAASFVETGGPVAILDSVEMTLLDIDSAQLQQVDVAISNLLDGSAEVLAVEVGLSGLSADYDSGTGVLTLTGPGSPAAYREVLRSLTYANGSLNPDQADRTVSFVAQDAEGDTGTVAISNVGVVAVNAAPGFVAGPDIGVLEDAPAYSQPWATQLDDGDGDSQVLSFVVTANSNPGLFSAAPMIEASTGSLSFTLNSDANGSAEISIQLQDDGGTASGGIDISPPVSFTITATAVNDAPSFSANDPPPNITAAPVSIDGWASFDSGAENESDQSAIWVVSDISNPQLFDQVPTITGKTAGDLTYALSAGAAGSSSFTVRVRDSGGTENGGVDLSSAQLFTITVLDSVIFDDGFEGASID